MTTRVEVFVDYPMRIATLEAARRAALLTVKLRASGIPPEGMKAAIRESDLRDPFEEKAFDWSADRKAVVFQGDDSHRFNRHIFFY